MENMVADMTRLKRLSKSVIGEEEKRAVMGVLEREYLGMGTEVKAFEDALTDFFDRKTICVNTGTAALQLALQAAGIGKGDEVLIQSLTYVASFQAISATGAIPVPCEVTEKTLTIDLRDAEKKMTKKTKAIMPVHYAGCPGDLDAVYALARKNGIRIIEDAAHAFGTSYKEKIIGSFGDIACFSFDGIKNITCGEGGAVVTDDREIIQKVSDARLLGVQKDAEKRYEGKRSWDFDVAEQGWRYHMSNIMAAIGIEQLKKFPSFKKKRQQLAKVYRKILDGSPKITMLDYDYSEVVPHIFVVRLSEVIKEQVIRKLNGLNIQTGIHYKPNHLLSYYRQSRRWRLPLTEKIYSELLTLPLHPDLSNDDVAFICRELLAVASEENS